MIFAKIIFIHNELLLTGRKVSNKNHTFHKKNEMPKAGLHHKYTNQRYHIRAKTWMEAKVLIPLHGHALNDVNKDIIFRSTNLYGTFIFCFVHAVLRF